MTTLHESLSAIERHGASVYRDTRLAHGHADITRTVRRARTTRASIGAVAAVGLLGGVGYGIARWAPPSGVLPAAPSVSDASRPTPGPTPGPIVALRGTMGVVTGGSVEKIAENLAPLYGVSVAQASAAIDDAVRAAVPQATTSVGWVKPGQYNLEAASTLEEAAAALVGVRVAEFTSLAIPEDQWQEVLTKASLVEREAPLDTNKSKLARVIDNRLAQGMRLELDSTARFLSPSEGLFTTDEERAIDSPYNTYVHEGLPPGAVSSPTDISVDAVLHPAEGDWLFFVTVNLTTGETAFASTFEGHMANVAILQQWIKDNTAG